MEVINNERKPKANISGSYAYGWQQMLKHFLYLFIIFIVVGLFEAPLSAIQDSEWENTPLVVLIQLLAAAYGLLFLPVVSYGGDLLFLRAMRNEKVDISELFNGFRNKYLNIILANLLTFAIIGFGFLLLIVPGIILACRLAFVPFLVMDKNLDPVAAVEKSWAMTRGYGWKIFGMGILMIPIFIAGLLCFIVGVFFAIIWIKAAFASMYHAVDLEEKKQLYAPEEGEVF